MTRPSIVIDFITKSPEGISLLAHSDHGDTDGVFPIRNFIDQEARVMGDGGQHRDISNKRKSHSDPLVIGQLLYKALFQEKLGAIVASHRASFDLFLTFNPEQAGMSEVYRLPWELLHDGKSYLFLGKKHQVYRRFRTLGTKRLLSIKPPLHILALVSCPEDLATRHEFNLIHQAWENVESVRVTELQDLSERGLREVLNKNPRINILHFMGHGSYDWDSGEGFIHFNPEHGPEKKLGGNKLAQYLADYEQLSLVFLNACSTASAREAKGSDIMGGVCAALVLNGIPAVMGMMAPVGDRAAIVFSEHFYRSLAKGSSLADAVGEARLAIFDHIGQADEWSNPILFLREGSSEGSTKIRKTALVTTPRPGQLINRFGMVFAPIPPGVFEMGSRDARAGEEERPLTTVDLSRGFYLCTTPVTNGQWDLIVNQSSGLPAHEAKCNVSWKEVEFFLYLMMERDPGMYYRLPTEAEWEYACRAGSKHNFFFGSRSEELYRYGWFNGNYRNQMSCPVASKQANPWGLYDMHGYEWEWCSDWKSTYPGGYVQNFSGTENHYQKVARGGSKRGTAWNCRAGVRAFYSPHSRKKDLGFRILLEI